MRRRFPRTPLSAELAGLAERLNHGTESVTLGQIIAVLRQRAYIGIVILLAAPFCQPVPLPGLSTPFGIVIALIGFRIALGRKPWLPPKLLALPISNKILPAILAAASRLVGLAEKVLRPRFDALIVPRFLRSIYGALICISGLLLLLPLPIPFTNWFPAVTIVLLAASLLERDGLMAMGGVTFFLLTLTFFGILYFSGSTAIKGVSTLFN
ncbi:Uncharacterized conserved protein [Verrucomicrobium sp. GAS474]|uniref:exopolysaccharide biosynthesis protein n=1 Tax=Verrucomicrobium sp. GAS474 TaxID=1882831 RepID=UPI00087A5048|nr:exopolysaccharide biosynthesis protein [Verrucomicrobium sp. GAS474]SDU19594.1 Uncharacterized conserved protein [Verrucomicrobium sp. GAS474]